MNFYKWKMYLKQSMLNLNNTDLVSVKSIINRKKQIDPESDDFFRGLKKRYKLTLAIYKDALQNIPLKPPMEHYYVSSPYGPRKHPVTGKYRMHHGIDLSWNLAGEVYLYQQTELSFLQDIMDLLVK